jgi:hypothetical protein
VSTQDRWSFIGAIQAHPWLVAWSTFLPFVIIRAGTLAESDTFWQVRTGLLTISSRAIPTHDSFSWTATGEPWTLNSWGFNVVLGGAYTAGGLVAVAAIGAAMTMAILGLALLACRRSGSSPVVAAVLIHLSVPLLTIYFSVRPQLVDYAAVLLLVLLLHRITRGGGAAWAEVGGVGLVMLAWVNLHAAVPLGVAIIVGTLVFAAASRATRPRVGWLAAAVVMGTVSSLVNPYGTGVITQATQVADASRELITEWQPLDMTQPLQAIMFLVGLFALGVAARRRDVAFTAALAVTAAGSVVAMRLLPMLLLVALPVVSSFVTSPSVLRYITSRRVMLTQGAVLALTVQSVLAVIALGHLGRPDPNTYSPKAVEAIPSGCRLFNSYDLGGFVILKRPDVPVSIDSRNDLYGVERVSEHHRALAGDSRSPELARADCALLPAETRLAEELRSSPEWQLEAGGRSLLFVRRSGG